MALNHTRSVVVEDYTHIQKEAIVSATVTPGMLIELESTGKIKAHSTAGGNVERIFAFVC